MSTPGPTSTRTRVRAVHYLNDEPQSGTPCRMGPQSREGLHSVLIFMRRFWQQFTHGGNFKAVNGFQPRIIFARSQNWQLWAKNVAASDNRGVWARSQSRNYFGTRTLLEQSACLLEAENCLTCQETCWSQKIPCKNKVNKGVLRRSVVLRRFLIPFLVTNGQKLTNGQLFGYFLW